MMKTDIQIAQEAELMHIKDGSVYRNFRRGTGVLWKVQSEALR